MLRSSKSMRYVSMMGLLLGVSFALLMSAGCSRNGVSSDDQNQTEGIVNFQFETGEADQNFAGPKITFDYLVKEIDQAIKEILKLIDSKGGVLTLTTDFGTAKFEIPARALSTPTWIRMAVTNEVHSALGPLRVYDFGPDGTKFAIDSKLIHPVPSGQLEASIYYFNPATGAWEFQERVKVSKGYATFNIKHFSKYGIS